MNEDRDDYELVAAARRGDEAAMQALWRRHRDWAFHVARRFTRQDEAAQDVVQEVFRDFFRGLATFELRGELRAWLWPQIRNRAVDRWRRERRYVALPEDHDPPDTAAHADPAHAQRRVHEIATDLPEDQRAVLLLRFVDALRVPEIAARLGIPAGTVKSRLHVALARLRRELGRG